MRTLNDITEILRRVQGVGPPVLIGGQAVNYWAATYLGDQPQHGPFTSKDVDFQGSRATVEACSDLLPDSKVTFPEDMDHSTPNSGLIRWKVGEDWVTIDFLTQPHGLDPKEVERRARRVELTTATGPVTVRVMHPIHSLQSRVLNVADLPQYRDAHALGQLRASILCVQRMIDEVAKRDPRGALKLNKRVFNFARSRKARKVYREHGIDVFDAVSTSPELPEAFHREHFPRMRETLAKRRERSGATRPASP